MVAEASGLLGRRLRIRAGSVRVRTTFAAVAVVGFALMIGAMAFVGALRTTLTQGVRDAAWSRAAEVAAIVESSGGPGSLAVSEGDEQLLQVLDEHDRVIASSGNVKGKPPVVQLRPDESATIKTPINDHDEFVAVATAAHTTSGQFTVIVARALADVVESIRIVTRLLLVSVLLLLGFVAFTTWTVVGRALAPVEAIRREVDEISAAALDRRVPAPPGDDEIARLAATMNQMLGRLHAAQERQRRFISDASHELRSPVASIRQHAEVALAHPEGSSITGLAETVLAEDLRLLHLVEDLLLLARADEHNLQLHRRPVDLDDVVFEEARRLRDTTSLRIDTTGVSAGPINGDAMGLRRVLRNLSDNATRHARQRIAFTLIERDDAVVLTVEDDGPGIPDTDRARVWERFVRLDDARDRDHGGSGLGLAIVAELITAHRGSIDIGDGRSGGARIAVTLPARHSPRAKGDRLDRRSATAGRLPVG